METVYEREFLVKPTEAGLSLPGFASRYISRLAYEKPTPNALTIETNHLKRDMKRNIKNIVPLLEYQLWLEAG